MESKLLQSNQPGDQTEWSLLTDAQKVKKLLGSTRMLDIEEFLKKFQSIEQPTQPESL